MKTHVLIQGSPDWLAYRATVWNASDAPAMMGCSPYKTREQLLQELATGVGEEITPEKARIFADGHRFEALARPLAEEITGEELAPVVGSSDVVIAGRALSASFDGLDFMETVGFEHKSLNQALRECMEGEDEANRLPLQYRVQMEQQLMVSGAERILFMASKWDGDTLVEERHCWYRSDPMLRAQIAAGWAELAEDLAKWVPTAAAVKPVGKSPELLPALHIEVTGKVTASNLADYKAHALAVLGEIKRDPSTDEEFADAEKTVKWCADVETRLAAAKDHALSQTADIDALFRTIDEISAEARRVRLDLDKTVKARKDQLRLEIVHEHQVALSNHVQALNNRLHANWVRGTADFATAIKGKRTLSGIREACGQVLSQAKAETSLLADNFEANRTSLIVDGRDWASLFPDFATVGSKSAEDFEALAQLRITRQLEQERLAKEAEEAKKAAQAAAPAPVLASVPVTRPAAVAPVSAPAAPAANEPATLKLGTICERLGFTMTAAFVSESLGVQPAATDKSAKLYRESDYQAIVHALIARLQGQLLAKAA